MGPTTDMDDRSPPDPSPSPTLSVSSAYSAASADRSARQQDQLCLLRMQRAGDLCKRLLQRLDEAGASLRRALDGCRSGLDRLAGDGARRQRTHSLAASLPSPRVAVAVAPAAARQPRRQQPAQTSGTGARRRLPMPKPKKAPPPPPAPIPAPRHWPSRYVKKNESNGDGAKKQGAKADVRKPNGKKNPSKRGTL